MPEALMLKTKCPVCGERLTAIAGLNVMVCGRCNYQTPAAPELKRQRAGEKITKDELRRLRPGLFKQNSR